MKVGDHVSWMGAFNFGSEVRRVYGRVVKVGLGVPVYERFYGPYQEHDSGVIEVGRVAAVEVVPNGHVPHPHEKPIVIRTADVRIEPRWPDEDYAK